MEPARILIVEVAPNSAPGIRATLVALGYAVVGEVPSADRAAQAARELVPDLILADLRRMVDTSGVQAAEKLIGDLDTPAVFLTAANDPLQKAAAEGAFHHLQEPFRDKELQLTIEMTLLRGRMEKRLADAIAEAEAQRGFFEALFETNPDGILVVDAELRVKVANRVLDRMLGIGIGSMSGKPVGEVIRCAHVAARRGCGEDSACKECGLLSAVFAALAGSEAYRNRVRMEWRVDGTRRRSEFLVSARGIDLQGRRLAVVILEDVTELIALRRQIMRGETFGGMVGRHPKMLEVFDAISDVAEAKAPVLILGESGTGKELVARAIHDRSQRARAPFVPVNCGALPESLLESELFGHVRGSFTGAIRDKKGRFELADGGTIFLDEIGDLTPLMQVKLLRVLQEGTFERVGAEQTLRVDVRVISATHKNLRGEIAAGRFRDDLFYRLSVVPISLPPLRERREDIPLLVREFLGRAENAVTGGGLSLADEALELLMSYDWPGNVRELQNALQYAAIKSTGAIIGVEHFPPTIAADRGADADFRKPGRLTRQMVAGALRAAGGNRSKAARNLGVSRATLYRFFAESDF